ncbi:LamG-like jellyroll fold domain-containing protein [Chitinophaga sp. Cy-1792]|uniref:LamG-like jellyroll fold domain-containing protein n=1 Tax=Chitinophaga sp. Cy-1792 TaxID=2608339 RepID=UPI001423ECBF|nr:LamG-like jellyroll fold domain-containing protein [Chitinophaga sp. Cy-1792]
MKFIKYILGGVLLAGMATSCTKVDTVPGDNAEKPKFSDKSKVLVVIVDGLAGQQLKAVRPPALMAMMEHSTYSYETQADTITTDGASLAAIYTGVAVGKNEIRDSALTPASVSGARYAPFLSLIKKSGQRQLKTISVTAWSQVNKTLLADATVKVNVADNDVAVRDSAAGRLKSDSLDLMFVQFNSINKAGASGGFTASNAGYATAITTIDGYINDLMTAMKSRPDYSNENWLVIVQSTHGGLNKSYGGDSDEEMNAFSLYYCPDLFKYQVDKPQMIQYGVAFHGADASAANAVLNDNTAYDFASGGQWTLEMKVKSVDANNRYYPPFFSKRPSFTSGATGWCFFQEGTLWQINMGNTGKGNIQCKGATIADKNWHHLTVTITKRADGKKYMRTYTDGLYNNQTEFTSFASISTPAPLTLGYIPGNGEVNMYISDVRIWADSLPADIISKYSCTNVIDASHPYYNKLIGYWPLNERKGTVLRNKAPNATGKDFNMSAVARWDLLNYTLPCQGNMGLQAPPATTDLFYQISYWMDLKIDPNWEIGGRLWLKFF